MTKTFLDYLTGLNFVLKTVSKGALIFERDDPVRSFFQVESGLVHLVRRQEDGVEFILQRALSGDALGEASLSTQNYHCSAVAMGATRLRIYQASHVNDLLARNIEVAHAFVHHLGVELRHARLRAEIVSLRRVADRLDAWLVWHKNDMPEKGEWHRVAAEIGVSPEAFYRELARRR